MKLSWNRVPLKPGYMTLLHLQPVCFKISSSIRESWVPSPVYLMWVPTSLCLPPFLRVETTDFCTLAVTFLAVLSDAFLAVVLLASLSYFALTMQGIRVAFGFLATFFSGSTATGFFFFSATPRRYLHFWYFFGINYMISSLSKLSSDGPLSLSKLLSSSESWTRYLHLATLPSVFSFAAGWGAWVMSSVRAAVLALVSFFFSDAGYAF